MSGVNTIDIRPVRPADFEKPSAAKVEREGLQQEQAKFDAGVSSDLQRSQLNLAATKTLLALRETHSAILQARQFFGLSDASRLLTRQDKSSKPEDPSGSASDLNHTESTPPAPTVTQKSGAEAGSRMGAHDSEGAKSAEGDASQTKAGGSEQVQHLDQKLDQLAETISQMNPRELASALQKTDPVLAKALTDGTGNVLEEAKQLIADLKLKLQTSQNNPEELAQVTKVIESLESLVKTLTPEQGAQVLSKGTESSGSTAKGGSAEKTGKDQKKVSIFSCSDAVEAEHCETYENAVSTHRGFNQLCATKAEVLEKTPTNSNVLAQGAKAQGERDDSTGSDRGSRSFLKGLAKTEDSKGGSKIKSDGTLKPSQFRGTYDRYSMKC